MNHYTYDQSTGHLCKDDGEILTVGYSGLGVGKNNPALENQHNVGPIPCGWYTIEGPFDSPTKGPVMFKLIPDKENEMYGRTDFEIHGDSMEHPGQASNGCIVAGKPARWFIAGNIKNCNRLQVI